MARRLSSLSVVGALALVLVMAAALAQLTAADADPLEQDRLELQASLAAAKAKAAAVKAELNKYRSPDADADADADESEGACDADDGNCDVDDSGGGGGLDAQQRVALGMTLPCADLSKDCQFWADAGECDANPTYMLAECKKSCTGCVPDAPDPAAETAAEPEEASGEDEATKADAVVNTDDAADGTKKKKRSTKPCTADHPDCQFWADSGECDANPGFMMTSCTEACTGCKPTKRDLKLRKQMLKNANKKDKSFKSRCKRDKGDKAIIKKGGLNKIFERITTDPEINARFNVSIVSSDPWIVTIDDFVESAEATAILGSVDGRYEGSSGVGETLPDGSFQKTVTEYRTSRNAWCHIEPCVSLDETASVEDKIALVTGVPREHQEYLQVLDYGPNQYYKQHHDFIPGHMDMPCGPRILTAFVYFNEVEEGGGTKFNKLGLEVQPKPGRMLLWPSVLNANPKKIDPRTDHEATPVIKGTKQAANAWLHLYEFRKYNARACTG